MNIIEIIAEQKIQDAQKEGVFDDLPGKGKPLEVEDLSRVDESLRGAYILLKNNDFLPEELQLKKELVSLQSMIACCDDSQEEEKLKKRWNQLQLRFNMLMEKRNMKKNSIPGYINKVMDKLG